MYERRRILSGTSCLKLQMRRMTRLILSFFSALVCRRNPAPLIRRPWYTNRLCRAEMLEARNLLTAAVGDFDGDGLGDYWFVGNNISVDRNSLVLGNGTGLDSKYDSGISYGERIFSFEYAGGFDFDADGYDDYVSSYEVFSTRPSEPDQNGIRLQFGNEDGGWLTERAWFRQETSTTKLDYPVDGLYTKFGNRDFETSAIPLEDFDGDGFGDFAVVFHGDGFNLNGSPAPDRLVIYYGNAEARQTAVGVREAAGWNTKELIVPREPELDYGSRTSNEYHSFGDFDGDGLSDIVIHREVGADSSRLEIIYGRVFDDCDSLSIEAVIKTPGVSLVTGGDVNSDRIADLALAKHNIPWFSSQSNADKSKAQELGVPYGHGLIAVSPGPVSRSPGEVDIYDTNNLSWLAIETDNTNFNGDGAVVVQGLGIVENASGDGADSILSQWDYVDEGSGFFINYASSVDGAPLNLVRVSEYENNPGYERELVGIGDVNGDGEEILFTVDYVYSRGYAEARDKNLDMPLNNRKNATIGDDEIASSQSGPYLNALAGNDVVSGDFLYANGGPGNDMIVVSDWSSNADGGTGADALHFTGLTGSIDLTGVSRWHNFETVDLTSETNQIGEVAVDPQWVQSATSGARRLVLKLPAGASLDLPHIAEGDYGWYFADASRTNGVLNKEVLLRGYKNWGPLDGRFTPTAANLTVESDSAAFFTVSSAEMQEDQESVVVKVFRHGDVSGSASVRFATVDGTATTADADYESVDRILQFADGQDVIELTLFVNKDFNIEDDEWFYARLSEASNADILIADAFVAIRNDESYSIGGIYEYSFKIDAVSRPIHLADDVVISSGNVLTVSPEVVIGNVSGTLCHSVVSRSTYGVHVAGELIANQAELDFAWITVLGDVSLLGNLTSATLNLEQVAGNVQVAGNSFTYWLPLQSNLTHVSEVVDKNAFTGDYEGYGAVAEVVGGIVDSDLTFKVSGTLGSYVIKPAVTDPNANIAIVGSRSLEISNSVLLSMVDQLTIDASVAMQIDGGSIRLRTFATEEPLGDSATSDSANFWWSEYSGYHDISGFHGAGGAGGAGGSGANVAGSELKKEGTASYYDNPGNGGNGGHGGAGGGAGGAAGQKGIVVNPQAFDLGGLSSDGDPGLSNIGFGADGKPGEGVRRGTPIGNSGENDQLVYNIKLADGGGGGEGGYGGGVLHVQSPAITIKDTDTTAFIMAGQLAGKGGGVAGSGATPGTDGKQGRGGLLVISADQYSENPEHYTIATPLSPTGIGRHYNHGIVEGGPSRVIKTPYIGEIAHRITAEKAAIRFTENEARFEVSVSLSNPPSANVSLHVLKLDDRISISSSDLTFTPSNWNVPQQIIVSTAVDFVINGDIDPALAFQVAEAGDLFRYAPKEFVTLSLIHDLSPADDSIHVPLETDLQVTYATQLTKGTGNVTIRKLNDDSVVESVNVMSELVTINGNVAIINPVSDLESETDYYVTIDDGAFKNASGVSLPGISEKTFWNFKTPDTKPPTILSLSPEDNATEVSSYSRNLEITFDEPISMGVGSIKVRRVTDNQVVQKIDLAPVDPLFAPFWIEGSTFTVDMVYAGNDYLPSGTHYYVTIDSGTFVDGAGNPFQGLNDSDSWDFYTESSIVRLDLSVTDLQGNAFQSNQIPIGIEFLLSASLVDLRPSPQGVRLAEFNVAMQGCGRTGPITDLESVQKVGDGYSQWSGFYNDRVFSELGLYWDQDGPLPDPAAQQNVWQVKLLAETAGHVEFVSSISGLQFEAYHQNGVSVFPTNRVDFGKLNVTLGQINEAPTLAAIDDLVIDENTSEHVVALTGISAGCSEPQPLKVTAVSDNPSLVPNPIISYASPEASGSLKLTPLSDQTGVSKVSVTVEDGGLDGDLATKGDNASFARTFDVIVNAINDLPTLDVVGNLTIDENASEQTVNLTGISAGGGESQPLRVTAVSSNTALIANPAVTYTSANATGSLAFTPVADQSGTATITVTVEDGGLDGNLATPEDNGSFSQEFVVQVGRSSFDEFDGVLRLDVREQSQQVTIKTTNSGLIFELQDGTWFGVDVAGISGNGTSRVESPDATVFSRMELIGRDTGQALVFADPGQWRMGPWASNVAGSLRSVETPDDESLKVYLDWPRPWQNAINPSDVNNDRTTTALDALQIINELSRGTYTDSSTGFLRSPAELEPWPGVYYDQNGDGRATALDALRVINDLARGSVSGEGEAVTADYLASRSADIWSLGAEIDEEFFKSEFEKAELLYSDADIETLANTELPEDFVYATVGQEITEAVDSLLSDLDEWWKQSTRSKIDGDG